MVDLTSETCRKIVSYHADKNEARFRSQIDHHDDQTCGYHHFGVMDSPTQWERGANGDNAITTDHHG